MFTPHYSVSPILLRDIKRITLLVHELNQQVVPAVVLAEQQAEARSLSTYASTSTEEHGEPGEVLIASLCPPCLLSVCSVSFPYQPTLEKPCSLICVICEICGFFLRRRHGAAEAEVGLGHGRLEVAAHGDGRLGRRR